MSRGGIFQSTLPVWGATRGGTRPGCSVGYFNPRSPCGERPGGAPGPVVPSAISIHAPRVGSDLDGRGPAWQTGDFNPRSPCGERRHGGGCLGSPGHFNPRSPCGERHLRDTVKTLIKNFNPRSPCGERLCTWIPTTFLSHFNPRSPCGERLSQTTDRHSDFTFQSTLPVWGATKEHPAYHHDSQISIHAPRVGSDVTQLQGGCGRLISIHAPRVGSDGLVALVDSAIHRFQSTLPVWGATCGAGSWHGARIHFNPRSPCGERRTRGRRLWSTGTISIHAPRVGSDSATSGAPPTATNFNPRSPCGERREGPGGGGAHSGISIHAPRVGSDGEALAERGNSGDFNPRSPCGERHGIYRSKAIGVDFNPRSPCGERRYRSSFIWWRQQFQSTLPVWGATFRVHRQTHPPPISIHAPRVGSDVLRRIIHHLWKEFQSTLPVWGATLCMFYLFLYLRNFNPRSPCGERPGLLRLA